MYQALDTGESASVADAFDVVAYAPGMTEVAREAGVSRESLYRALKRRRQSEFGTVMRVARALGLQFSVTPVPQKTA